MKPKGKRSEWKGKGTAFSAAGTDTMGGPMPHHQAAGDRPAGLIFLPPTNHTIVHINSSQEVLNFSNLKQPLKTETFITYKF